jgi:hypothetical protein
MTMKIEVICPDCGRIVIGRRIASMAEKRRIEQVILNNHKSDCIIQRAETKT